jgi:hypothetical protein
MLAIKENMKTIAIFLAAVMPSPAADKPVSPPVSLPPSAIQQAKLAYDAAVDLCETTSGSASAATAARKTAEQTEKTAIAAHDKAVSDAKTKGDALAALITPAPVLMPVAAKQEPVKIAAVAPPPVAAPRVSLLAITAPSWCPGCKLMQPKLDALKGAGMPITIIDPSESSARKYFTELEDKIPMLVLMLDGKEWGEAKKHSRIIGDVEKSVIENWYNSAVDMAKK